MLIFGRDVNMSKQVQNTEQWVNSYDYIEKTRLRNISIQLEFVLSITYCFYVDAKKNNHSQLN